jgi:hypothetical protein
MTLWRQRSPGAGGVVVSVEFGSGEDTSQHPIRYGARTVTSATDWRP